MAKKISVGEAAAFLGVSRRKVWQMIKKEQLRAERDPLDERKKLISMDQLTLLKLASHNSGGK